MSEPIGEAAGMCMAAFGCKGHAAVGYLCRGHFERLGAMLREVEDEAAILSAVPSMQQRMGSGSSSLASQRSPGRLNAIVLNDRRRNVLPYETPPDGPACSQCWHETCMLIRNFEDAYNAGAVQNMSVLNTLHSWARVVRTERRFAPGGGITITGERDLLTRQLDWIAAQLWVDEFYSDLVQLVAQLKAANGHRPDRPYSRCPALIDGEPCVGHVWFQDKLQPVWRRYIDRCAMAWEKAPGPAVCDTCGATWATEGEKARLKRMIADAAAELDRPKTTDGRRMLTAEELVAQGKVSSVSNVRVSAHRLGKVSVDGHYDPEWFVKAIA